jgi:hypothetical protein
MVIVIVETATVMMITERRHLDKSELVSIRLRVGNELDVAGPTACRSVAASALPRQIPTYQRSRAKRSTATACSAQRRFTPLVALIFACSEDYVHS